MYLYTPLFLKFYMVSLSEGRLPGQIRVSPCQLGQELHPTSQNSPIFNFYDPFSGVRDTVNFYCSIPISLEMTAF